MSRKPEDVERLREALDGATEMLAELATRIADNRGAAATVRCAAAVLGTAALMGLHDSDTRTLAGAITDASLSVAHLADLGFRAEVPLECSLSMHDRRLFGAVIGQMAYALSSLTEVPRG